MRGIIIFDSETHSLLFHSPWMKREVVEGILALTVADFAIALRLCDNPLPRSRIDTVAASPSSACTHVDNHWGRPKIENVEDDSLVIDMADGVGEPCRANSGFQNEMVDRKVRVEFKRKIHPIPVLGLPPWAHRREGCTTPKQREQVASLFEGTFLVFPRQHAWLRRADAERPGYLHSLESSSNKEELDEVQILWRAVGTLIVCFCLESLSESVALARQSQSVLFALLPEALKLRNSDVPSSKMVVLHTDVIAAVCELVAPLGILVVIDITAAKQLWRKQHETKR